jgi:hypothetical protein
LNSNGEYMNCFRLMHFLLGIAIASTLLSSDAFGGDSAHSPIDVYKSTSDFSLQMCSAKFLLSQTLAESVRLGASLTPEQINDADYKSCIQSSKVGLRKAFDVAFKSVRKPAGKGALKKFHLAVVSALEGINPGQSELKIVYDQRQQNLSTRQADAWAEFELEQF